ncbi:7TM domain-containing protein [Aquimarina aquimarini]|uniref:7TM domain-containing protein n=1 Tax=Aquimarina aquimarini TaxID=1191734 RepID=UPI000D55CF15|nr:7TM domain-containing protein [Aquimarina aquimarini]
MNLKPNLKIALIIITIIALISIGFKAKPILGNYDDFNPEKVYKITYRFFFKSGDKNTTLKTYIPTTNSRQRISGEQIKNDSLLFFTKQKEKHQNIRAIWETNDTNSYHSIDYEFIFEGKAKHYKIPNTFNKLSEEYDEYLKATNDIQSNDSIINTLASGLIQNTKNDREIIKNIFDYVYEIPSAPIITLTDALTTIKQNKASCNGKSRLFVALCRNMGYPARVKGGIIVENANKRTSHAWVEVLINQTWVPFDGLNNHFAFIPANYLELYQGDKPLITHTADIQFDYSYQIDEVNHVSFLKMNSEELHKLPGFSLWNLVDKKIIPKGALNLLLLLPIGGLLVAFLRNIVGLKTFGVFLPVLIAFSLSHTGFVSGIAIFVGLIMFIGLIAYPFDKLRLLYTPKLVISLTIMVSLIVVATHFGVKNNIEWLTKLTFFPIIILTISAERFSRSTLEDGYIKAMDKLFQTLIATSISYLILSWTWLPSVLILFPEIVLLIVVLATFLGRYIGIRWIELFRFKPLFNSENKKLNF